MQMSAYLTPHLTKLPILLYFHISIPGRPFHARILCNIMYYATTRNNTRKLQKKLLRSFVLITIVFKWLLLPDYRVGSTFILFIYMYPPSTFCHTLNLLPYPLYTDLPSIYYITLYILLYPLYTDLPSIYCPTLYLLPYLLYTALPSIYYPTLYLLPHPLYTALPSIYYHTLNLLPLPSIYYPTL